MKKKTRKKAKLGSGIVAGVLAAGAAGYFLFGPNGKKNRKKVHEWMMEVKADIVDHAMEIKAGTKEEFEEVVDTITDAYVDAQKITLKEAKELKKELISNWDTLAVMLLDGNYKKAKKFVTKKVTSKAKKTGKKVVKKTAGKKTATKKKKPAAKKKPVVTKKTTTKKTTTKKKPATKKTTKKKK